MTTTREAAPRNLTVLGLPRCPHCGYPALRTHGPNEPRLVRRHGRVVARLTGRPWWDCLFCDRSGTVNADGSLRKRSAR